MTDKPLPDLVCFDLETTGVDVFEDRIVTASITTMTKTGEVVDNYEFLINPGVEIPQGAIDTHGITNEYVREHGYDADATIPLVYDTLRKHTALPLVIMNAQFDVSLLHYEMERHTGGGWHYLDEFNIIDPMILDRTLDKYRKGPRKLVNLAEHYGVPVDESKAHDSTYDNYLAGNVAIAIVRKYKVTNGYLKTQPQLYREWATGLEEHKRKTDKTFSMSKDWPLKLR